PNIDQLIAMVTRTLLSRPRLEELARKSDLDIDAKTPQQMEQLIDKVESRIELVGAGKVNLFTITYGDEDPTRAKRVVQELVTLFVESGLGTGRTDGDDAQRFIGTQITEYQAKLAEIEDAMKEFKRQHAGQMPGTGGDYFARVSETGMQLNEAKLTLREAEMRRDSLQKQLAGGGSEDEEGLMFTNPGSGAADSGVVTDPKIQALEAKLDEMRLNYTEQHPDIVATKRVIAQLQEQKKREAQTQKPGVNPLEEKNPVQQQLSLSLADAEANVASLRARVAEYESRHNTLKAALDAIPQVEVDYARLLREYDVTKSSYTKLLERRETAQMSGDMDVQNGVLDFRIIDPPRVPPNPDWPNRPLFHTLVLFGGLAAGIAVAFVFAQLRPTVDGRRTLQEISALPVLGAVSMVLSPVQALKKRKNRIALGVSGLSLAATYGVVLTVSLVALSR
ncbi:MAG: XrtA system polysaccharide chain length determinant, partial [Burkholderiales bacterium]